jgi:hypothetical protein
MMHGSDKVWMVEPLNSTDQQRQQQQQLQLPYPQSQFISEGNGGEMRKSYHGYPQGYAQLIQSPDTFTPVPMQIDTWNRHMENATYIPGGPLPRSSQIRNGEAGYNPLLECPCSDRLLKKWQMTYTTHPKSCQHDDDDDDDDAARLQNATECYLAATQLIPFHHQITMETLYDTSKPAGCMVSMDQYGSLHIEWNSYNIHRDTNLETPATSLLQQHQPAIIGVANGVVNVTVVMNPNNSTVTITMSGPNDQWFGTSIFIYISSDLCVFLVLDPREEKFQVSLSTLLFPLGFFSLSVFLIHISFHQVWGLVPIPCA